jgi:hypothetical protein
VGGRSARANLRRADGQARSAAHDRHLGEHDAVRLAEGDAGCPKAEHIRELLDRLRRVRDIGLPVGAVAKVHEERLRQFVREGYASDAHQLGCYAARRRRAILVATVLDLERRLTDAVLDMADKLVGGLFAKAGNATRRRYAASAGDVGRLMRLFHGTIDALAAAQADERDAFDVVDETVGWAKLLRVRGEVADLAKLAEEDPLLRAADRWKTLRKFAPDLIEALEFRAARAGDPMLAALQLLAKLNRSGRREVPLDAPMPFRKEWRRIVMEDGTPNRRLYETAVLATLRDKLRSGDIWVERSSSYRRFDSYLLPPPAVPATAAALGLPATADEWLATRAAELDRRLRRFARRLRRGELEGSPASSRRHLQGLAAAVRAARPSGRHPRALGRGAAPGRVLAGRHRPALGDAEAAGSVPAPEPARSPPAGAGQSLPLAGGSHGSSTTRRRHAPRATAPGHRVPMAIDAEPCWRFRGGFRLARFPRFSWSPLAGTFGWRRALGVLGRHTMQ